MDNTNEEVLDGWGSPFPPEKQQFHLDYIRLALERYEQQKLEPSPPIPEPIWKDTPAGRYQKGSGV